jgi:hypothetical protein
MEPEMALDSGMTDQLERSKQGPPARAPTIALPASFPWEVMVQLRHVAEQEVH